MVLSLRVAADDTILKTSHSSVAAAFLRRGCQITPCTVQQRVAYPCFVSLGDVKM